METLRDLLLDISLKTDSAPLYRLNREMNQFVRSVRGITGDLNRMDRSFQTSTNSIIKEGHAFNNSVNRQTDFIRELSKTAGTSATQLASDWSFMSEEMRKSMIQNHNNVIKHRKDLLNVENDLRKLGLQMGHYKGTTNDFLNQIHKLGKTHKKITDEMINNNMSLRQGFIQSIATMSAMSGQSEKISANYDRMGNAFLKVNKPLLGITNGLERMARQGNAASLALKMLGPNASMKALQDQVRLINQGIMRQQAVLMVAGVAWLGFTAILAKSSIGPDPEDIRKQQAEISKVYRDTWQKRVDEIAHFVGIFERVSVPKVKKNDVMKALRSQLKAMQTFRSSLQSLTKKGVDEGLIKELQKAGPAAAYQIQAIDKMSKPELNKYVATWREKMGLARTQATDELTKLRKQTAAKIKELQDSIKPLGKSWEKFKTTWASALKPFVEFWGQFAAKIVDMGTAVGKFINKLNEISPWITKIGGMFLFLFSTFMVILSPIAVGIGLFGGLQATFTALWAIIGPFVLGFASVAGTALLVSGALIAVGAALYLLWTRSETFRNGVISGWSYIKSKALEVWGFIRPYIMQAIHSVVSFGSEKLAQFKSFWNENGAQILGLVKLYFMSIWNNIKIVFGFIKGIFQIFFPIFVGIAKIAWAYLKLIINNGLTWIMGIIKTILAIIRGDWDGAWQAIKDTAVGIMNNIIKFFKDIDLVDTGKAIIQGLIDGIGSMSAALGKKLNSLTSGINWVMDKLGIEFQIPEVPTYAKGTNYHPGGPAIVGEKGRELIHANGRTFLADKQMMLNLPRGASVLPNKQTEQLIATGIPAYAKGVGSYFSEAWDGTKKVVGKVKDIGLDIWSNITEPSKLMSKVFDKFGVMFPNTFSGALSKLGSGSLDFAKEKSIGFIKKKIDEFMSFNVGGAGSAQAKKWITTALRITGTPMSWLSALMIKAEKESTFNPRAINLWDSNAKRGTPSKGLLQTIDPTFNRYKLPGMDDIWNPIHNSVAAIRYIKDVYGTVFNTPGIKSIMAGGGYKGYAKGTNGPLKKSEWAWVGENGPELMRLQKGTEVFSNRDSRDIVKGEYNPSSGSSPRGSTNYIDFNPTYNITVEGGSDNGDIKQKIKDTVRELTEEQYQRLIDIFGIEVVL